MAGPLADRLRDEQAEFALLEAWAPAAPNGIDSV